MNYLFYKLIRVARLNPTNTSPALSAILVLMLLQWMNLLLLSALPAYVAGIQIPKTRAPTVDVVGLTGLAAINWQFLFRKRREIDARFRGESKTQGRRGILLLILYIAGSLGLFFLVGPLISTAVFR